MKKIILFVLISFFGCEKLDNMRKESQEIMKLKISDIDFSEVKSGKYFGRCNYTFVGAEVEVLIQNGEIKNINILNHNNMKGKKAEEIIKSVIQNQSLKVDMVSGATYSSKVILKSIENSIAVKN